MEHCLNIVSKFNWLHRAEIDYHFYIGAYDGYS